jgi:hypothetical protein
LGPVNGVLFISLVPVVALDLSSLVGKSISLGEVVGSLLAIFSLVSNNLLEYSETRSVLIRMMKIRSKEEGRDQIGNE